MRGLIIVVAAASLAACASRPVPVAVVPVPAPVAVVIEQPPAPTPLNAGLSEAATLWHLRAGLNVAALACRGPDEAATVQHYNAMLARHAALLKAAEARYAAEYQAAGGDWRDRYDDEMTRLYNHFSQAGGRAAFCAAATTALTELAAASDVVAGAGDRLATLDRPFAPPRLQVDARVFGDVPVRLAAR